MQCDEFISINATQLMQCHECNAMQWIQCNYCNWCNAINMMQLIRCNGGFAMECTSIKCNAIEEI